MNTGFIFDLDGVLVDTVEYHFDSWKKLAKSLGFHIDDSIKESLKGISRMASLDIVLKKGNYQASEQEKISLAKNKNDWYQESLRSIGDNVVLPGIKTFIQKCQESEIPLTVGSASKNAKIILSKTSLKEAFVEVVDGNDVTHAKPDPEVFLKAAKALNLNPCDCIVFEDSKKGLEAAERAGFRSVGIGNARNLPNAHIVVKDLQNIHPKTIIRLVN